MVKTIVVIIKITFDTFGLNALHNKLSTKIIWIENNNV